MRNTFLLVLYLHCLAGSRSASTKFLDHGKKYRKKFRKSLFLILISIYQLINSKLTLQINLDEDKNLFLFYKLGKEKIGTSKENK